MTLVEAVLAVLLAWPSFYAEPADETGAARRVRLTEAAIVVTGAAVRYSSTWEPVKLAAALLALGHGESRFAAYVGRGQCLTGPPDARCDPWRGVPRAVSYWQAHRGGCPAPWRFPPGTFEHHQAAAECAARRLQGGVYRCRGLASSPEAGGFASWRGIDCSRKSSERRARLMIETESRLRRLMTTKPRNPSP